MTLQLIKFVDPRISFAGLCIAGTHHLGDVAKSKASMMNVVVARGRVAPPGAKVKHCTKFAQGYASRHGHWSAPKFAFGSKDSASVY